MGREVRRVPMDWQHPKDEHGNYIPMLSGCDEPDYPYPVMPKFTGDDLGWQMYEDTSEGTPISPVFDNPEALADWLAETGASAFADLTATREQWLRTIMRGYAVGAVLENGILRSGVEYEPEVIQ